MLMKELSYRQRSDPRRAFTLLEILVAMGIMVILGGGLVALMSQAIALWNRAENSGRVYDQARAVVDLVALDLRSTVVRSHAGDDNVDIRFICDRDPKGRQRLRFVRTISGETKDPILREGGRYLGVRTPAVYDGRGDAREAREGLLRAPGGMMEVFYAQDPRPGEYWLWRGVRAPVGGSSSLFRDSNIEGESDRSLSSRTSSLRSKTRSLSSKPRSLSSRKRSSSSRKAIEEEPKAPDPYEGVPFRNAARPITDGVLFLGFSFWGPTTNTWDPGARPALKPDGKPSGPVFYWDSTRALLDQEAGADEFAFRQRPTSLNDPTDDVFPEMVEITLVLKQDEGTLGVRVTASFGEKAKDFFISRPLPLPDDPRDRFLLVDEEWIAVESIDGRIVTVADGGRGVRDTKPVKHEPGSLVQLGATFRRVVSIPGHRSVRFEPEERRRTRSVLKTRRRRR